MRRSCLLAVSIAAWLACSLPANAVVTPPDYGFQWATITHPGNAPFTGPFPSGGRTDPIGRVDYEYRISKNEVSAADYAGFANAQIAIGDPWLIATFAYFDETLEIAPGGGALQPRTDIPQGGRLPARDVSWYAAAMFCNWLHNEKTSTREAMEYGAYDLRGININSGIPILVDARLPGAKFFLPSRDEWVKAAFFDPQRHGLNMPGYWKYPTTSDTRPVPGPPGVGETNAGFFEPGNPSPLDRIGMYPGTTSPWGLLDVSGGSAEWLETTDRLQIFNFFKYVGGHPGFAPHQNSSDLDAISVFRGEPNSWGSASLGLGFRIGSFVPSPAGCLPMTLTVLLTRRRRPVPRQT